MKKSLVLMAMAGVALAGCVNDVADVTQIQEQKKAYISFETPVSYANGESRANFYGEIGIHKLENSTGGKYDGTYSYPTIENFVVFAKRYVTEKPWSDLANFWNNGNDASLEVFYDSEQNAWTPAKKHAWPDDSKLVFAAYSPSDLKPYASDNVATKAENEEREQELEDNYTGNPSASVNEFGVGISDFKVADNPACQFDLLYTRITDPVDQNYAMNPGQGQYYGTTLVFNHALTSIHFAVKKPESLATHSIVLKKLKLLDVKNEGGFEVNDPSEFSINDPSKQNVTWTLKNNKVDYPVFDGSLEFPYDKAAHVGENGGYPLLVLPQSTENIVLYVEYTVDSQDKSCYVDMKSATGQSGQSVVNITNWFPGYRYVYNLMYSAAANDFIYFNPTTVPWTNVDVNIDLSKAPTERPTLGN